MPDPEKVDAKNWLYGFFRRGGDCSSLRKHELKAMIAGLDWLRREIQGGTFTIEPTVEVDGLSRRAEEEILKDEHSGTRVGRSLIRACIGPVFDSSFTIGVPDKEKALIFVEEIRAEANRRLDNSESPEQR